MLVRHATTPTDSSNDKNTNDRRKRSRRRIAPMQLVPFVFVSLLGSVLSWANTRQNSRIGHIYSPARTKETVSVPLSSALGMSSAGKATRSVASPGVEQPSIMKEINIGIDVLIECLNEETSGRNVTVSNQPMRILNEIMTVYSNWCVESNPSTTLKFRASAGVDKAFRLVTNEAFSAPYRLEWVNVGVQALKLQQYWSSLGGAEDVERRISLQPPYNNIPRGTWLKSLRAFTSREINPASESPSRTIMAMSPNKEVKWLTPASAAFRVLQTLVKSKRVRAFYNKKKPKRTTLDERDFNMCLHAFASNSNMVGAHRVIALQERTRHAPPLSPVTYSILLNAYGRAHDAENVEMSVLHAKRNAVVPDIVMANTLVDAYVNCGQMDKAQDVFHSLNSMAWTKSGDVEFWPRMQPNSRTFNTLLKGFAELGDVKEAMKLSREAKLQGLWDEITTNTLVKTAVTAGEFVLAEDILTNYTVSSRKARHMDHPNVEAYTELLDGYAKYGQLDNALRVMQVMQKRNVEPNEYTYTCIVGALARNNKIRQARKMIEYAAESSPSRSVLTPTYNAFVSGLLSEDSRDETAGQSSHSIAVLDALNVLREMQELGIRPNVVTVALIVDGLGKCNPPRCDEARELVNRLEHSTLTQQHGQDLPNNWGISLKNNKIAAALIQAYGRANDAESALKLFERIPSPDLVTLNSILDALCRCNKLKRALHLFKDYSLFEKWNQLNTPSGEVVIKPDVVTYTTLISSLLQLRSKAASQNAVRLYSDMKSAWWIQPDNILVDTILNSVISGGFIDDEIARFVEEVLADGSLLEWETGLFEKRRKAVRDILVGSWNDAATSPKDKLFAKKGWNTIDSGFRLWGGGIQQDDTRQEKVIDEFLLSKGWNEVESGFRIL